MSEIDYYEDPPRRKNHTVGIVTGLCAAMFLVGTILLLFALGSSNEPAQQKTAARPAPSQQLSAPQQAVPEPETQALHSFLGFMVGTGLLVFIIALIVAYIVTDILILAWVVKDTRNRGMDGGAVWVLVIFWSHIVGLLVYLASRPHGSLELCDHCHNRRLSYVAKCPHCGH